MTLTEFLLARIAEDEAEVAAGFDFATLPSDGWMGHAATWSKSRALADCEAKRRIVALHTPEDIGYGDCPKCDGRYDEHEFYPCQTLRALALPFADHPDYDESWRA